MLDRWGPLLWILLTVTQPWGNQPQFQMIPSPFTRTPCFHCLLSCGILPSVIWVFKGWLDPGTKQSDNLISLVLPWASFMLKLEGTQHWIVSAIVNGLKTCGIPFSNQGKERGIQMAQTSGSLGQEMTQVSDHETPEGGKFLNVGIGRKQEWGGERIGVCHDRQNVFYTNFLLPFSFFLYIFSFACQWGY